MNDFSNVSQEQLEQFVRDDIDFNVPKDVSIGAFIGLALECSVVCNSWRVGMIDSDSLDESIVIRIAQEVYSEGEPNVIETS